MSSEQAKKYYNRSPRYVVQLKDNAKVRFAAYPKGSRIFETRVINLSETGMQFLLPYLNNPKIDEVIKIEFSAPNAEPIACFARVVRIDTQVVYTVDIQRQTFKLVAVEFMDLPEAQQKYIRQGLAQEFSKIHRQQKWEQALFRGQWLAVKTLNTLAQSTNYPRKVLRKLSSRFKKKSKVTVLKKYADEE